MNLSFKASKSWGAAVLILCCLFLLISNFSHYTSSLNLAKLENRYLNSQYAKPSSYKYFIDDPEVYSYAGLRYILSDDPSVINFEHQPLAKYFMGVSIVVFGNAAVMQFVFASLCLLLTYILARKVLPGVLSCLPVILLTIDPLFRQQSAVAYLDIYQLAATLFLFWCVGNAERKPIFIAFTCASLGIVSLMNAVWSGIYTGALLSLFILLRQRKYLRAYLANLYLAAVVYLLGYIIYFRFHSPLDFIRLHIQQIRFYSSYVPEYPKGEIFRILFTGMWRKWFGDFSLMQASPYSPLWPITLVLSLASLVKTSLSRLPPTSLLLLIWVLGWLFFISLKLVFPRYLLVILPAIYILGVVGAVNLYNILYAHRHQRKRS